MNVVQIVPPPPQPVSRRKAWLLVGAVAVVVAAASGVAVYVHQSDSGHASAGPLGVWGIETPPVWVGTDDNGVAMMELTRTGRSLSGSLDITAIPKDNPTTTKSYHAAFTGSVDGTSVTLRIDGALGTVSSMSGTLTNSELDLHLPDSGGTMETLVMRPGTIEAYNKKVSAIQSRAGEALSDLQDAQAEQAQAAADAEAKRQIDEAAAKVGTAYSTLKDALASGADYSTFETDIATARQDLGTTNSDADLVASQGPDDACVAAYTVQSDADTVQADADTVQADRDSLDWTITAIEDDVKALKDAWKAYQDAQALMPDYVPVVTHAGSVSSLKSGATAAVSEMKRKGDGYVTTANGLADKASKIASAADAGAC